MNSIKRLVVLALLGIVSIGSAWADRGHHGHAHFSMIIGPYWGPWYYPPQPYYYPPYYPPVIITERAAPPVYIEQSAAAPSAPAAAPSNYWYYCAAAKSYYPYVKECPGGWQRVVPQPPAQP